MRSSVKSGLLGKFEHICDEKRSGSWGESTKEPSESTADADEEIAERLGFRYGLGFLWGGKQESVWSCTAGAADTQEEGGARCVGAGPPL